MSRSKFAIKRIKERQNNPEIWDAAYEIAEEWSFDVDKILSNRRMSSSLYLFRAIPIPP